MGNIHLVTGYKGEAHITSADQGAFNAAVFGNGQYVLEYGNQFSASVTSNNNIRVLDGEILMQGRHIRINPDEYVDLTISNGSQGMYRNDLIVARYTKNTSTGIEDCNLVVIEGTASSTAASDPAYTAGDILTGNATQNDMPLYRVPIDGINVGDLVPLFSTMGNFDSVTNSTIAKDRLPVVPITKGGTNATTAAKALTNLGAVNKTGDTMTGTLKIPGGSAVYGDSWPTLEFEDTAGNMIGGVRMSDTNRVTLIQREPDATYGENYMLPTLTKDMTSEGVYSVLTTKNPVDTAQTDLGVISGLALENSNFIIPQGADLNDYITPGAYKVASKAVAATLSNAPYTNAGFRLLVSHGSHANSTVQVAIYNSSYPNIYVRTRLDADNWVGWGRVLTTPLSPYEYGSTLPETGTAGQIFFKI